MQLDTATGLYYDNARYYDSSTGQFISQDPTGFAGGNTNLYGYVNNDPTNLIDPTGLSPKGNPGGGGLDLAYFLGSTVSSDARESSYDVEGR
jgi:RHS repeat-associated protein